MRGGGGLVIVRGASYPDANDMHGTAQRRSSFWDAGFTVLVVEVNVAGVAALSVVAEVPEWIWH